MDGVEVDEDPGFGVVGADGMPRISERAEGVRDARRLARMLRARCARGLKYQIRMSAQSIQEGWSRWKWYGRE